MLNISRDPGTGLVLAFADGTQAVIAVKSIRSNRALMLCNAPRSVRILRSELLGLNTLDQMCERKPSNNEVHTTAFDTGQMRLLRSLLIAFPKSDLRDRTLAQVDASLNDGVV